MNAADTLRAQQRALQHAIMSGDPAPGLLHAGADGAPPLLGVYRHAYRARLVAALGDNHSVLRRATGDEAFEALGAAYVQACPSVHPSIRWYGDRLAAFMDTREDLVPHPALADIARMDWALRDAFDAADAPVLAIEDLARFDAEQWAALRFVPHPAVRLVPLQWAIEAAWRALREYDPDSGAEEPTLAEPEPHAHLLLVWRRGLETQWRSLPDGEAALLQAALAGEPFGDLCERAAHQGDAETAALTAATCLQQWLHDGLFTDAFC